MEDEKFSGTVRNDLTEPDEGVSVESRSIKDLYGIRLLACVAWEEQDSGHQSSCCGVLRCAVVVVDFRRIRWLGWPLGVRRLLRPLDLQPNSFVKNDYYPKRDVAGRELSSHMGV